MFRSLVTRGLALLLLLGAPAARAVDEESPNEFAENLSTLGRKPDWSELEKYQATITHDEFVHLLNDVYCTRGYNPDLIKIEPDTARILTESGTQNHFVLHFAKSDADRLPLTHWWTAPAALPTPTEAKPLAGFHVALDPGHLGGTWAKMEERWFKIGDASPVQEGDMTLRVAQLLAPRLQSLGAKVSLVRDKTEPITPYRPRISKRSPGNPSSAPGSPTHGRALTARPTPKKNTPLAGNAISFYRNSEIRRRASLVNYRLQPDLVLCLHFNAEPWGPAPPYLGEEESPSSPGQWRLPAAGA